MTPVQIIGVPLDLGAGRRGVDMRPSALRITGLDDRLAALGVAVIDRGNIATPIAETKTFGHGNKRYITEIRRVCHRLHEVTLAALDGGFLPTVLGGDHSLTGGRWPQVRAMPSAAGAKSDSSGSTPTVT